MGTRRRSSVALAALVGTVTAGLGTAGLAHGDAVAYLVNVTVRPGYNFANALDALQYGNGVCDKVARGQSYETLISVLKADFRTGDEYQTSYLIAQAVNELCPAQIWQLRNSAAGHPQGGDS